MLVYIKEENFFTGLTWLHPTLSGILVSMLLGDHFINSNGSHTILFWQSCCYKIKMLWEDSIQSISYNVNSPIVFLITLLTLFTCIALYFKKRQLENQRIDQLRGIEIVSFSGEGVTMSRRSPDQPPATRQILWKHYRTVVSPKASFVLFLTKLVVVIPHIALYFQGFVDPSGPPLFGQFFAFIVFCKAFFLVTLIETIFSPTLRNSLTDFVPCCRQEYRVPCADV